MQRTNERRGVGRDWPQLNLVLAWCRRHNHLNHAVWQRSGTYVLADSKVCGINVDHSASGEMLIAGPYAIGLALLLTAPSFSVAILATRVPRRGNPMSVWFRKFVRARTPRARMHDAAECMEQKPYARHRARAGAMVVMQVAFDCSCSSFGRPSSTMTRHMSAVLQLRTQCVENDSRRSGA